MSFILSCSLICSLLIFDNIILCSLIAIISYILITTIAWKFQIDQTITEAQFRIKFDNCGIEIVISAKGDDSYRYHESWWHEIVKREIYTHIYRKKREKREKGMLVDTRALKAHRAGATGIWNVQGGRSRVDVERGVGASRKCIHSSLFAPSATLPLRGLLSSLPVRRHSSPYIGNGASGAASYRWRAECYSITRPQDAKVEEHAPYLCLSLAEKLIALVSSLPSIDIFHTRLLRLSCCGWFFLRLPFVTANGLKSAINRQVIFFSRIRDKFLYIYIYVIYIRNLIP